MFAKLSEGALRWAPNPIKINNTWIGNPTPEILITQGYKQVILSNPPEPITETGWWDMVWTETETEILQDWTWRELEESE